MRLAATCVLGAIVASAGAAAEPAPVVVYKTESCGCCGAWVEHMQAAGFILEVRNVPDLDVLDGIKRIAGVPGELASCHTALVEGYVIEGHVPAAEVQSLLDRQPDGVAGLAAPGMPQGSPGMPAAIAERYDVIGFGSGASRPVATYVGEQRVD